MGGCFEVFERIYIFINVILVVVGLTYAICNDTFSKSSRSSSSTSSYTNSSYSTTPAIKPMSTEQLLQYQKMTEHNGNQEI